MKAGYRRLTWLAVLTAAATGVPLLAYRHLIGEPAGDALAHPGETWALYAHVVAAPWLLFVCGMLWPVHVLPHLSAGDARRRPGGVVLALALFPLVLTGYLAQATDDAPLRAIFATVHGFGFTGWLVVFGLHVARARAQRRRLRNGRELSRGAP